MCRIFLFDKPAILGRGCGRGKTGFTNIPHKLALQLVPASEMALLFPPPIPKGPQAEAHVNLAF